ADGSSTRRAGGRAPARPPSQSRMNPTPGAKGKTSTTASKKREVARAVGPERTGAGPAITEAEAAGAAGAAGVASVHSAVGHQAHQRVLDPLPEPRGERPRARLSDNVQRARTLDDVIVRCPIALPVKLQRHGGVADAKLPQRELGQPFGQVWVEEQ